MLLLLECVDIELLRENYGLNKYNRIKKFFARYTFFDMVGKPLASLNSKSRDPTV